MNRMFLPMIFAALTITAGSAQADVKRGEPKEARSNDVATEYVLGYDGTLFRRMPGYRNLCPVATNVNDFKISKNPQDDALIYFTVSRFGQEDLYALNRDSNGFMSCLAPNIEPLMRDVKKFTVVSSAKTQIVNIALDKKGNLKAWGRRDLLLTANGIQEYSMNQCNDQIGRRFSSYVAFAESADGRILKIDGDRPREWKFTQERYFDGNRKSAIQMFKMREDVCGIQRFGEMEAQPEAAKAAELPADKEQLQQNAEIQNKVDATL